MKQALSNVDWAANMETLNTNESWLLFKSIFQGIIDEYVPTYKQKRKEKFVFQFRSIFSLKK